MFTKLNTPLNVILTILVVAVAIFILLLLTAIIFAAIFSRKIKRTKKALVVVIATKHSYLKKLYSIAEKIDGPLNEEINQALNSFDLAKLAEPASKEFREIVNKLTFLRNEMDFLSRKNVIFTKHEEFLKARQSVLEMDSVYQKAIANYNNDIYGYNYWIRFLPCRFVFLMFKIKKKEVI